MGRGRDFRGPRRRGFNDDDFTPAEMPDFGAPRRSFGSSFNAQPAMAEGPEVAATVKWFNGQKGFGFVELADGTGDAFLHVAVLQAAGRQSVLPGAKMRVATAQGPKGRQVARVIDVDESTATEPPRRPREGGAGPGMARGPRDPSRDLASAVEMTGTVKWFNTEKGFGFIAPEGGGKDVFIHISVLGRSGLTGLSEGQQVSMRVVETPKGREALSVTPAG
ncbi:MAG TPA: cold-shock protein [Stellaceae bacterium]|jgi:CspA family cold shock protein|nr:cold-shock protein [Stellaceae bacterium]